MDLRAAIAAFLLLALPGVNCSAFDTVINLPNDPIPSSIGSNTQLNISDRGLLRDDFVAGKPDGTSDSIEVNVTGGRVGRRMKANAGSVVNVTGGLINTYFYAMNGSVVNISGTGSVSSNFQAESGSTLNMSAGSIGEHFAARDGSVVNISGGLLGGQAGVWPGSAVTIAGGAIGNSFVSYPGSHLTIVGNDFTIDGHQIPGLVGGDKVAPLNVPWDSVLAGTLADGTPFAFHNHNYDRIRDGSLTLREVSLPSYQQKEITVTDVHPLYGAREGEILRVRDGGILSPYFTAGSGSQVIIDSGGTIEPYFDAVNADVVINGGTVHSELKAFHGSTVVVQGGGIDGSIAAMAGSYVMMAGGQIQSGLRVYGGQVEIAGGQVGNQLWMEGGKATITGGTLDGKIEIYDGSALEISGGSLGYGFRALSGSEVKLIGSGFSFDGVPIEGLTPGIPLEIAERNVLLSCTLADGSPLELLLNDDELFGVKFDRWFAADATLTVTLVAEPSANKSALHGISAVLLLSLVRSQSSKSKYTWRISSDS